MIILKSFLSLILLFILAVLFIGILLPKNDQVIVKKQINCNVETIYPLVNNLRNWEKWSPWYRMDPQMDLKYSEITIGKGAQYAWKGNSGVGAGELKIVDAVENNRIDMLLNYEYRGDNPCQFTFKPNANGSEVTWTMNIKYSDNPILKYIFGGYRYTMMNFFLSKNFNAGLENLSNTCK